MEESDYRLLDARVTCGLCQWGYKSIHGGEKEWDPQQKFWVDEHCHHQRSVYIHVSILLLE